MDENLKNVLKDIWKDKPLLIALLAAAAIAIFLIWKNAQSGGSTSSATTTPSLGQTPATYVEGAGSTSTAPAAPVAITGSPIIGTPILGAPISAPTSPVTTAPAGHAPGTTFLGPSGVKHYVTTGSQTLVQIAQKFGLKSWNSIYAIPDNMNLFRGLWGKQAKPQNDVPPSGTVITLPGSTIIGF